MFESILEELRENVEKSKIEYEKAKKKRNVELIRTLEDKKKIAEEKAAREAERISEERFSKEYKTWTVFQKKQYQEQVTLAAKAAQKELRDHIELIEYKIQLNQELSSEEEELYRNRADREKQASDDIKDSIKEEYALRKTLDDARWNNTTKKHK